MHIDFVPINMQNVRTIIRKYIMHENPRYAERGMHFFAKIVFA